MRNRTLQDKSTGDADLCGPLFMHMNVTYSYIGPVHRKMDSMCTVEAVPFSVRLPQRVDIKQRRLQLRQLDGGDAHGPDVAAFVVASFNLHCCHLRSHPEDRRETATSDGRATDSA